MSELSVAAQQCPVAETSVSTGRLGLPTSDHYASSYINYDAVPEVSELAAEEEEPEVDIVINNVVCSFNTRCHLSLKRVAMEGMNVIYKRDQGVSTLSRSLC